MRSFLRQLAGPAVHLPPPLPKHPTVVAEDLIVLKLYRGAGVSDVRVKVNDDV
jgi:hypothetical protein